MYTLQPRTIALLLRLLAVLLGFAAGYALRHHYAADDAAQEEEK